MGLWEIPGSSPNVDSKKQKKKHLTIKNKNKNKRKKKKQVHEPGP